MKLVSNFCNLQALVHRITLERKNRDSAFCHEIGLRLEPFLADPSWIPSVLMLPHRHSYRRETLYEAADQRFTVACLTWLPAQATPIHDHYSWGVIGVVAGALRSETYTRELSGELIKRSADQVLVPGMLTYVHPSDPSLPDIHRLGSATNDVSVSIHIYGCTLATINRNSYPSVRE